MGKPIIEVKHLGKRYSIRHKSGGYLTLRDSLAGILKNPFASAARRIKSLVTSADQEEFWALKDLSFSIEEGEIVGIIGGNGAGKSTLLKILTGITPPTEGEAILRGRISSLLEVGTGFHPELTGRENIMLNGAILGMKRNEIIGKFDEIVQFAGIDRFLDTPVKFYSSGMYVRLAFSVAAHMEPDILLVDEVLAVGDAEFQRKCLGKMEEVTQTAGRTILFVSHNMSAIQHLCKRTLVLNQGKIDLFTDTETAIKRYEEIISAGRNVERIKRKGDGRVKIVNFRIEDDNGKHIQLLDGSPVTFVFSYICADPSKIKQVDFGFSIYKHNQLLGVRYGSYSNTFFNIEDTSGELRFKLSHLPFSAGRYEVSSRILIDGMEADTPASPIGFFDVVRGDLYDKGDPSTENRSFILIEGAWKQ